MEMLFLVLRAQSKWTKVRPSEACPVLMEGQRLNTPKHVELLVELKISLYSTFLWVNKDLHCKYIFQCMWGGEVK